MAVMASSALLPCRLQLLPFSHHEVKHTFSANPTPQLIRRRNHYSISTCTTMVVYAQSQSESMWEREGERWLREEKRWLREEARWLREEARWNTERMALEAEISSLRLQIQNLQQTQQTQMIREGAASKDVITYLAKALQSLGSVDATSPQPQISIKSSTSSLSGFDEILGSGIPVESLRFDGESKENSGISVDSFGSKIGMKIAGGVESEKSNVKKGKKRRTLRKGSDGADVREMQEALERLGFYSGEEDMEFSSFDSGTESAVKSWQANLGIVEDGRMTAELLAKLLGEEILASDLEEEVANGASVSLSEKEGKNGTVKMPTVTEIAQVQETIRSEPDGVEISERRVYLLGENRWEEPQRLINNQKQKGGTKADTTTRCFSCRGQGKLHCTECEGSGELNVEEQFLEWAEGAKCPYCEGSGFVTCDVCAGKGGRV